MLEIVTLGDFDIIINNRSIMEDIGNKKQLIKLFKYFLIHNDTKLLPETIIDDLWTDEKFKNPINMLRTQISRLRKILTIDNISHKTFYDINYINGYYIFRLEEGSKVDFIEFQNMFEKDGSTIKEYIEEDIMKVKKILTSYKGDLLVEENDDWIIPIRSMFSRLYVKAFKYYTEYLEENSMVDEIIKISQKATVVKPYEEIIHLTFMEALINLKEYSLALVHYEFFTRKLYNDLRLAPSEKLKKIYNKIKTRGKDLDLEMDLEEIDKNLLGMINHEGALLYDFESFKKIYNYVKRNKSRQVNTDIGTGMGIITIYSKSYKDLKEKQMKEAIEYLTNTLSKTLRKGDMISKCNNKQIVILLYGLREKDIGIVADKIRNSFNQQELDKNLRLKIKIEII